MLGARLHEVGQHGPDQVRAQVQVLDGVELPGQFLEPQAEDHRGRHALEDLHLPLFEVHPGALHRLEALGLGLASEAGLKGCRLRLDTPGIGLGPGTDLLGLGHLGGLAALVLPLLGNELLLALSELDAILELILLDGPLLLHGHGPALEGGLVGLLLDVLSHGGLKGLLKLGVRLHRRDPDGDHLEAYGLQQALLRETRLDPLTDLGLPLGQDRFDTHAGEVIGGVLLGHLGEHLGDALQGLLVKEPRPGVQREVDPACELGGVLHAVADDALGADVLEVDRAPVEDYGQFTVVSGNLGQAVAHGQEPEGQTAALLQEAGMPEVQDVRAGVAPEVTEEGVAADLGHGSLRQARLRAGKGWERAWITVPILDATSIYSKNIEVKAPNHTFMKAG